MPWARRRKTVIIVVAFTLGVVSFVVQDFWESYKSSGSVSTAALVGLGTLIAGCFYFFLSWAPAGPPWTWVPRSSRRPHCLSLSKWVPGGKGGIRILHELACLPFFSRSHCGFSAAPSCFAVFSAFVFSVSTLLKCHVSRFKIFAMLHAFTDASLRVCSKDSRSGMTKLIKVAKVAKVAKHFRFNIQDIQDRAWRRMTKNGKDAKFTQMARLTALAVLAPFTEFVTLGGNTAFSNQDSANPKAFTADDAKGRNKHRLPRWPRLPNVLFCHFMIFGWLSAPSASVASFAFPGNGHRKFACRVGCSWNVASKPLC
jgi:hypothetical protein